MIPRRCFVCRGRFWIELPPPELHCPYCRAALFPDWPSRREGHRMVPAWTIQAGNATAGIVLEGGAIPVGGEWHGSELTRVPVPLEASVDREGVLKAAPTSHPDVAAVVLIENHSGLDGGWELLTLPEQLCPLRGKLHLPPWEHCPVCDWKGSHGPFPVRPLQPSALGHLIAQGRCAQMERRGTGEGPEYLIAVRPGQFCIHRTGRHYSIPRFVGVCVYPDGHVETWDVEACLRSAQAVEAW